MWSSLLLPQPVDAEPAPAAGHEPPGDSAPEGAGVPSEHERAPTRAAGWSRWLPGWTQHRAAPGSGK